LLKSHGLEARDTQRMSQLRFNHVFFVLMLLAALAAFVIPQRISSPAQAQLQVLFSPISRPIYSIAGWVHDRAVPKPQPRDDGSTDHLRTADELILENRDLRQQNLMLAGQLDKLKELDAERAKVGNLQDQCVVVATTGGDSGFTDTLHLAAGSLQGLADGMVVLTADGLIGRLDKVGLAASQVQLIAAKGSKISVSFARFVPDGKGGVVRQDIYNQHCVAVGLGDGQLAVQLQSWDQIKDAFHANDLAILDDVDWPKGVTHYVVGEVTGVKRQSSAAGFGQIQIEWRIGNAPLKEVMVLKR
jgi:rod shape-determining protein MreC